MPSSTPTPLTADQVIAIARALADPRRFAIFEQIIGSSSMPCSALTQQEEISPATISHHLKELTEAGLIHSIREGRNMRLSADRTTWNAYLQRLQSL